MSTRILLAAALFAASFVSAAASAADPVSASDVTWARPFTLARPETWTMDAAPRTFTSGLLVELRVDPALAAEHQGRRPVLFVGDQPVFRFNWDARGGCVVGFVPGEIDLAAAPVYFGGDELPERLDAAAIAQERARAAAVRPLPADRVQAALAAGGTPLQAADLRDVHAEAMARVAACSATPEDAQRAGVRPSTNR